MAGSQARQLSVELLADGLKTRRVGRRILLLPQVDSTNTYALETVATSGGAAADGTVIFTEHQTAGRGRLGRPWHSPIGASLLMTALLWENDDNERASSYWCMAAAVAVLRGIEAATDLDPMIRWPNDVYLDDRKLAGILVEVRRPIPIDEEKTPGAFVAIGIGVNCLQHPGHFPEDIRGQATSLEMASALAVDRGAIAQAIMRALDDVSGASGPISDARLAAAWTERSGDIGAATTLVSGGQRFTGRIVDVHPQYGLVLQLETGARRHFDPATTSRL